MKLKTKLIPLTSLALLGTTVVPFTLTSCGAKTATNNTFNLTNYYYPSIERHENAFMTMLGANLAYVEQLKKNLDTFTQDLLWSKSWMGAGFNQFGFWAKLLPNYITTSDNAEHSGITIPGIPADLYQYDREMVSNLSMRTQSKSEGKYTLDEATLSFTYKFDCEVLSDIAQEPFLIEGTTGYVNGHISGEINFLDVPFHLVQQDITYSTGSSITVLSFEPDIDFMDPEQEDDPKADPWKIKFYISSTLSGEIVYNTGLVRRIANDYIFHEEAYPNHTEWEKYEFGFGQLVQMFTSTYYLERIEIIG